MRAFVDANVCTGCGLCVDICSEVFEMGGEAAIVMSDPVPDGHEESCQDAAESCPVEAISVASV